jgi:hypothetical protein
MRAFSNDDYLSVWERGARLHPLDRALLALSAAFPETSAASLADWPLGRRNQALAELRCACFGPSLRGWLACPICAEKLEFEIDTQTFSEGGHGTAAETFVVSGQTFRLPTSRDLARVVREADARSAALRLMEICRVGAGAAHAWLDTDLEAVGQEMAQADPLAEVRIGLHCPACGNDWDEALDILAFFWAEIEARTKRIVFEVHTLASAYGWSEREILALSPARRALYIEMAQS